MVSKKTTFLTQNIILTCFNYELIKINSQKKSTFAQNLIK